MKKLYEKFCKFEENLALLLLAGLTILVFMSALFRTFNHPLNWAQDVALVAFAWMIFIGGDVAVRGAGLIGVDLLIKKFPKGFQKGIDIVYKCMIIAFLVVLAVNGYTMCVQGWSRQITALHISYSWVTMAVPVGSVLMIISTSIALVKRIKTPAGEAVTNEKAGDIG